MKKVFIFAVLILVVINFQLFAQETEFTYQGSLSESGNPANGYYDFQFMLFDAESGGAQVGGATTILFVLVANGVFTSTMDFGSVFDGSDLWLEIKVKPNGSADPYTTLSPRQKIKPAPYAIGADLLDGKDSTEFAASSHFHDLHYWRKGGNVTSGDDQIGYKISQPVEIISNNQRVMKFDGTNSVPNIIGGHSSNTVNADVIGATISGGGASGSRNKATDNYATIGGGRNNLAGDDDIGLDAASAPYATVPGGFGNAASGSTSFAAGNRAKAVDDGTFVWADSQDADFYSTGANQFLIRAESGVGINTDNPKGDSLYSVATDSIDRAGVFENTADNSTALRAMAGSGTAPNLGGFYPGAGEFTGLNGVIGAATDDSTDGYGVLGLSDCDYGVGLYGQSNGIQGVGVWGRVGQADSVGVRAYNSGGGLDIIASGSGKIKSVAENVWGVNPSKAVIQFDDVNAANLKHAGYKCTLEPLDASPYKTESMMIPLDVVPMQLFGVKQKIKSVTVHYYCDTASSPISASVVNYVGSDNNYHTIVADYDDKTSTTWASYTLAPASPILIEGSLYLEIRLDPSGTGTSHEIHVGNIFVTTVAE